jgi:methyltransferase-like protein/2-polyprenyl-3-methyl-5-hydroxy-6-metoxy-1,4-benzoquinol methylase
MSEFAYDVTQYESYPYSQTHPEHLYTIARLFGLDVPHYSSGRILELGCAAGGNIIPIAFNYPDSRVVGVDFSKKQVDAGIKQISDLGLENITIRHNSLADIDESFGKFNYIICHGVFSWVPKDIQEKILAVIRDNLSDNGVAYVSYNTLPGWNIVKSYRDMMRYHIKDFDTLEEKAGQARSILKFMVEGQEDSTSAYAQFLQTEYDLLAGRSDSYLLHDHLAEHNLPVYFYEFMQEAKKHDLFYLGDTPVSNMFANNLPENVSQKLGELTDLVQSGQYMDFFRNQRFRCTILCSREAGISNISRNLRADVIEMFYLTFDRVQQYNSEAEMLSDEFEITYELNGEVLSMDDPVTKAALKILNENKLKPLAFDDLCKKIMTTTGLNDYNKVRHHLNEELNLMRLVSAGIIGIHSEPGNYIIEASSQPCVSKLARYQAVSQNWVTTQRHETVSLNLFERTMIQYMDGEQSYLQIFEKMCQHIVEGDLETYDDQQIKITDKEKMIEMVDKLCRVMIDYSLKNALLVG